MTILYSHTQFGRAVFFIAIGVAVVIGGFATFLVLSSGAEARGANFWLPVIVPAVVALGLLLVFSSLRITVTDQRVSWRFGPGFLNFSTRIGDIDRVEIVHPSLIYGIGIRITPKGWLYNVGAGNAIAITTAKKTVLVGTDDPDGLIHAIETARGRAAGAR
jgi:hypothetical protein